MSLFDIEGSDELLICLHASSFQNGASWLLTSVEPAFHAMTEDGALSGLARELRFEHSHAFALLSGQQFVRGAGGGRCAEIERCLICSARKHTVAWATRSVGRGKSVVTGGCCSCRIYACALFRCTRSVTLLVQSGAVIAVRSLSAAIRAKRGEKDKCNCRKCLDE